MSAEPEPEAEDDTVSPFTGDLTPELAADSAWCAAHAPQLRAMGLPAELAQPLAAKLRQQQFDAGESVAFGWIDGAGPLQSRESWFVAATRDIANEGEVWLSDHVWLFESAVAARAEIGATPELAARLTALVGTQEEGEPQPDADALLAAIAPLAHPIKFAAASAAEPSRVMHFVADEFGSRITLLPVGAPEAPNVRTAALFDEASQRTYSVVWPCADIAEGQVLQRTATPSLELIAEGGAAYWERRFDAEESFDWYCGWEALAERALAALREGQKASEGSGVVALVAGNGNSSLPCTLLSAGRTACGTAGIADGCGVADSLRVLAVDYVASVTERMAAKHPDAGVEWVCGDLTDWSSFDAAELGVHLVLDKGCLDALLVKPVAERAGVTDSWLTDVDDPAAADALKYLGNCASALRRVGGRLVLVTLGRRENREPMLTKAGLEVLSWDAVAGDGGGPERNGAWRELFLVVAGAGS